MKKKIFSVTIMIILAIVTSLNYLAEKNSQPINDLGLANIEALATPEGSMLNCYNGGCLASFRCDCWTFKWGYPEYYCYEAKSRGY